MKPRPAFVLLWFFFMGTAASAVDSITVEGSGTCQEALRAIAGAFSSKNPGTLIEVLDSIGTPKAIDKVAKGSADLARVVRQLTPEEKQAGLVYRKFARTPVVIVGNADVAVASLPFATVCDLFEGKITNWKDAGGQDGKVRVMVRQEDKGTLQALRDSLPGFKDLTITPKARINLSDQENFTSIQEIPGAIGFGALSAVYGRPLKILSLQGIGPKDPGYPIAIDLAFVYKPETFTRLAKNFMDFVLSPDGAAILERYDCTPQR